MAAIGQGILSLLIKDKNALHSAYMPFINQGGIFISTTKRYSLGDNVFILLNLIEEKQKIPISGKVVWLTQHVGPSGIGIQFTGKTQEKNQKMIETILENLLELAPESCAY